MAVNIEDYIPVIKYQGLNTAKNISSTGTNTWTGTNTFSGTTTLSGTTNITGAATQKANVISGSGATVTLTAAQSGSTVLFDRAAGIVYTLPAPAVGLYFDFHYTVTVTSNSYTVITDAGTTFVLGSLISIDNDSGNANVGFLGNGTSHVKIASNGTTTGGILGSWVRFTCVSSTVWNTEGIMIGSGVVATPYST